MTDQDFITEVADELADIEVGGVRQKGDQFAIWFAKAILGESIEDVKEKYHIGGSGDNKLDIAILDEDHDTIILAQCRYSDSPLEHVFNTALPEEAKNGRDRLISVPGAGNTRRQTFAKRYNFQREAETPERILAVGFGLFSDDAKEYALQNDVELYDLARLKDLYEVTQQPAEGTAPASLTLTVEHPEVITRTSTEPRAKEWIAVIDANEIYEAVKAHRHGLFAKNLRYKLTQASKTIIAKKIRDTLMQRPDGLLLFNNGLTFVATEVSKGEGTIILSHPQIVNGCQTSWAIYEALDELTLLQRRQRRKAELLVKIVETSDDPKLLDQIATSTNQQNAITDRDLRANDPVQREIASSFDRFEPPVLYENKEGGAVALSRDRRPRYVIRTGAPGKPPLRQINNTMAAQVYLAMLGLPYFSKQSKKLVFTDFYVPIFGINDPDQEQRFQNVEGRPKDIDIAPGVDGFRDDVLFGFAVVQLADGIRGVYEQRVQLYEEERERSVLQERAYRSLARTGAYHKYWQYLLAAAMSEVVRLWARRREVSASEIRPLLVGADLDLLFSSLRVRSRKFTMEQNLDHAYVIDEESPSREFVTFARWMRTSGGQLETLIEKEAGSPDDWNQNFRMQGFIDQRAETYKNLRNWIIDQYGKGPGHWATTFPLPLP